MGRLQGNKLLCIFLVTKFYNDTILLEPNCIISHIIYMYLLFYLPSFPCPGIQRSISKIHWGKVTWNESFLKVYFFPSVCFWNYLQKSIVKNFKSLIYWFFFSFDYSNLLLWPGFLKKPEIKIVVILSEMGCRLKKKKRKKRKGHYKDAFLSYPPQEVSQRERLSEKCNLVNLNNRQSQANLRAECEWHIWHTEPTLIRLPLEIYELVQS